MTDEITRKQFAETLARLTDEEKTLLKSLPGNERLILFEAFALMNARLLSDQEGAQLGLGIAEQLGDEEGPRPPRALDADPNRGQNAKTAGMQQALDAERIIPWPEMADAWLANQEHDTIFTADDLAASVGMPDEGVYKNNAVGAWFAARSKEGLIAFTGQWRKSARVIAHQNDLRVWRVASIYKASTAKENDEHDCSEHGRSNPPGQAGDRALL